MFFRSLCESVQILFRLAFFAFDISPTFKKLILNSCLWVKSTIILAKSIFLSDANQICLNVAKRETWSFVMLLWFGCDTVLCDLFQCDAIRCVAMAIWRISFVFFSYGEFWLRSEANKTFWSFFSEREEDELDEDDERPELASSSTEESVAPGKSIVLHDLEQI